VHSFSGECAIVMVMPRQRVSPSASPMTGSSGASSTPRRHGSISAALEYWFARSGRAMTPRMLCQPAAPRLPDGG